MCFPYLKIHARKTLLTDGSTACAVSLTALITKSALLALSAFFGYCIFLIYKKDFTPDNTTELILLYALFTIGVIVCLCFTILIDYNEKRWYFTLGEKKRKISYLFLPENISKQIKIVFLYLLKFVFSILYTLFFLLPSIAVLFWILNELSKNGIDKTIFILCLILFSFLFVTGLFFAFVSMQKYFFANELLFLGKRADIVRLFSYSKEKSKGMCFKAARFKLSFIFWFASGILIIPLFFVIPYYRQSAALLMICSTKKYRRVKERQKPVVLMHLATESI